MIRTLRETANTWHLLLKGVEIVKEHRDNLRNQKERRYQDIYSLNSILILNSAAAVEGCISGLLIKHVSNGQNYKYANQKTDIELRRILDDLIEQVHRGQWKELSKKSKLIIDVNPATIDSTNWEAIGYLFNFRNILAHGGLITKGTDLISDSDLISEITNEERRELHNREDLFKFLKKKELIDPNEQNHIMKWDLLNTNVTDFFMATGQEYMKKYYELYFQKYPDSYWIKRDLEIIREMTDRQQKL